MTDKETKSLCECGHFESAHSENRCSECRECRGYITPADRRKQTMPSLLEARPVGHWCAFVVGPSSGWDRTILGVVVYAGDGNLAFSRWCGSSKALQRGDWKPEWFELSFDPPATWEDMQKKLGSTGNGMSHVRWEGGYATTSWSEETGMDLFRMVTEAHSSKSDEMRVTISIVPDSLDGGFVAHVVELPGCASQGETIEEALRNIGDAYAAGVRVRAGWPATCDRCRGVGLIGGHGDQRECPDCNGWGVPKGERHG